MIFLQRIPAPPLDSSIAAIWYCASGPRPHALERVLPTGSAQLIVNLAEDQTRAYIQDADGFRMTTSSGTVLAGVQSRFSIIDTLEQQHVLGVSFKPGGTVPFFRIPAHETCDADLSLDLVWGRGAMELREQLMEAADPAAKLDTMERALRARWRPKAMHAAVEFAIETLTHHAQAVRIAEVANRVGLSPKRFIEHFKNAVGVSPKQYCRILRFQSALGFAQRGQRVDWTRIALECGYFDQSHFIHDFRSFSGITPTGYQSDRTEFRNHVKFLQF
ncbi:AraC family transcriptional regulator [uncultured Paludibaculum sp.]|uniref:AraC family transcriptional regulator n=1 Tax=uncultured Paludibaculum sp. TaxID=1765020 RepID=UPI002AABEF23|nr:AraC family transcriptional regulator [uncultured Paludibaculum sp.]